MTDKIDLTIGGLLGRVTRVDTAHVIVDVDDHALLTRVSVGNLVAVRGVSTLEFLIGIVDRVTRDTQEEALISEENAEGEIPIEQVQRDLLRLVLVGTYRAAAGGAAGTFKRGADSFPQIDRECHLIEGGNLQALMSTFAAGLEPGQRLQLGHFVADANAAAIADGNRLFQRHAALLGSTGTGKSWTVALILERAAALDHPNLVVFDMHGEYLPLATSKDAIAQGLRVAGPGDLDAPGEDALFLPYWLLNQEEMLALLLDRSDQNAPNQATRFLKHVRDLKQETLEAAGRTEVAATFTVDSPVPYDLTELLDRLQADDQEMVPGANKPVKGPFNGTLTRFIVRLRNRTEDRRYGFLFKPPTTALDYGWLAAQAKRLMRSDGEVAGIKIIDFSEVPSDVLPVVAGVLARTIYDVQFWMHEQDRTPICFVCDEAHLYLPAAESSGAVEGRALAAFERIAKEGRKYGVSLLVVSQRPSDVNRTILSQCNNFIAMRMTNDQDQAVIRRFTSESLAGLVDVLPLLDVGEALLLGDAMLLPTRVKFDRPSICPASATRDFWTDWGTREPDQGAIAGAVEAFRRQVRS
ncbi:MAG: helicase HerA domain-containing protein [Solirubrobacteraceae bacterium]